MSTTSLNRHIVEIGRNYNFSFYVCVCCRCMGIGGGSEVERG